MVYIIGWIIMLLATLMSKLRNSSVLVYSVILYLTIISFLRANVGTDTDNYVTIFNVMRNGGEASFGELGFRFVAFFLISFFEDELAVKFVSILFFLLLTFFYIKSDKNQSFFFIAYFLPVFSYAYSMNGLRIGLAASVFLIIVQFLGTRIFYIKTFFFSAFLMLFHYSAILYPVSLYFLKLKIFSTKNIIFLLLLISLIIGVYFFINDYFDGKLELYLENESTGIFSGSRIIIPLIVITVGMWFDKLDLQFKKEFTLKFIILLFLSLILIRISYAGLRILDLFSLSIPIFLLLQYKEKNLIFGFSIKLAFVLAGLINAMFTFYGFLGAYGLGESPFLPYVFR
jgi:hypothetical protein